MSNHASLRYRNPVYLTLREMVMSYFDDYMNGKVPGLLLVAGVVAIEIAGCAGRACQGPGIRTDAQWRWGCSCSLREPLLLV